MIIYSTKKWLKFKKCEFWDLIIINTMWGVIIHEIIHIIMGG